jgi:hypothetical protein
MKKTKIIHSNKLAGFLLMAGCKLLEVKTNLKNEMFNIYVFIDNDRLQENLASYMNNRKNTATELLSDVTDAVSDAISNLTAQENGHCNPELVTPE